jgi:hypothetical protein
MFDPTTFADTTIEDSFEEKRSLIPPGEYMMTLEEVEPRVVGERNLPILSVRLRIVNSGDEEADNRVIYHTVWLDMDDAGSLLTGPNKNINLGQLLSALGLNGKPWSPNQLAGNVVLGNLSHTLNKRSGEMEERITRFAKAS